MTKDKSRLIVRGTSWWHLSNLAKTARCESFNQIRNHRELGIRLVEVVDDPAPAEATLASGSWESSMIKDSPGRVSRGGGWNYGPLSARVADRYSNPPGERGSALGIRLVEIFDA